MRTPNSILFLNLVKALAVLTLISSLSLGCAVDEGDVDVEHDEQAATEHKVPKGIWIELDGVKFDWELSGRTVKLRVYNTAWPPKNVYVPTIKMWVPADNNPAWGFGFGNNNLAPGQTDRSRPLTCPSGKTCTWEASVRHPTPVW